MLDVKSVYRTHIVRRSLDDNSVELWCGRIGSNGHIEQPQGQQVCDSCRSALAFTCGYGR